MKLARSFWATALLVCSLLLVACDSKDNKPPTPSTPPPPAAGGQSGTMAPAPAPAPAPAVSAFDSAQVDKLIADATQYVKEHKMDMADKTIKQLEAMKSNLPADYQKKVEQLRAMFDTAKAAGNIPGMGK